ncbi:lysophospholipid acyltransferase family protein [Qipengyuania sp. JC766]|uniref:lysophospholipid acyltransferase family protein n=1 Tax=Qipengyuania sp. JC766 TaxID=3232139 RepID=UPI00345A867C
MIWLRNAAFYIAFYGASVFFVAAAVAVARMAPDRLKGVVSGWCRFHRWCVRRLLGIEIVVEGTPTAKPILYALKHESFFEAIDCVVLFGYPVPFAKRELFDIPGWGLAARSYGAVAVDRAAGARMLRSMMRDAAARVGDGRPLVILPEGTRVPHGERRPLASGFAGLYKMLGVPVVPVAVDSGRLYRAGLKRPGRITYRFGEEIPAGLPREEMEARVTDAINALNTA